MVAVTNSGPAWTRPTPSTPRRRSLPRIVFGVLAAVLGAIAFGVWGLRADPGVDVLAVARPVAAGMRIAEADLRVAHIVADSSLRVFSASQRATVIGQIAAVPLVAGSLLTGGQLGGAADPPPGQSVIAVGVPAGRLPAHLPVGASVLVLVVPQGAEGVPSAGTAASLVQAQAVVRAVEPAGTSGVMVVTLQLVAESAVRIASATGDVALVLQNPGR